MITAEYLDDLRYHCRGGGGNWYISLPDNIYNEDFIEVVRRHQEIIQNLKNHNMLDEYLRSQKEIEDNFFEFICNALPFDDKLTHKSTIEFDKESLKITSIKNELIEVSSADKGTTDAVSICLNILEYSWKPLRITYGTIRFNEMPDRIRNNCKYVSSDCMRNIVNKSLGSDY